ncbi:hypothetical protein J2T09_002369 [Neorhizobium huautlense]|uniref:Lipoprotein n=1 Tax=Neorhizobium huautlense TaxID=67774 RepID=A0ABT9PT28_9HYPH|nr:hypothetical protein [Neorhizobium huautlense]MDP9837617.1 hypothetical protein [Neorhizobium huautlense]
MKKIAITASVVALALSGCAGVNYAIQHYSGIKPVIWTSPTTGKSYRIYDKRAENRLMIALGLGESALQGIGAGATLGIADTRTPSVVYQDAALEWLATTGKKCEAKNISLVLEPQYEVRYVCAGIPA